MSKQKNDNFYHGEKKNKKFNKKIINEIADNLEGFYDIVTELIIISGKKKKVKEAEKGLKQMIKYLRNGQAYKVINYDAYVEYFEGMDR